MPLPNGLYEIKEALGSIAFAVESFTAADVSSRLGDRHFSKIEIKVKGFTCTDNYWRGPSLDDERQEPRNTQLALRLINQVILNAKLTNESLRLVLASQNDIGNVTTTQYDGDGEMFHFSLALGFGGFALVDVLSKQELNEEQTKQLAVRLTNRQLLLHEELYAQALIERASMNLTGAFYLLNSASEAMIDYYLALLSGLKGKIEIFEQFMKGNSFCTSCDLFNAAKNVLEPPRAVLPPSPFQKLKFLQEIGCVTAGEVRRLQSMLSRVRSDKMRNDLAHGRSNSLRASVVDDAIRGFQELRDFFSTSRES